MQDVDATAVSAKAGLVMDLSLSTMWLATGSWALALVEWAFTLVSSLSSSLVGQQLDHQQQAARHEERVP